jgi:manganese efflux pump family protein
MRGTLRGTGTASGAIRGAAAAAALLAAILAGGCSSAAPAPSRATVDTCYAFGVQALQRHMTVTTVPRACAGLSHAEVNLAVARAVREVAGPRHKAAARRQASREGAYLAHLINTVPPAQPAPLAAAPARSASDLSLSLAALAAWVVTAAAGVYLLWGWLFRGGLRRRRIRAAGLPPLVILGHAGLAVAGLGIWIAFAASGVPALAWTAVGLTLVIAGLGMATLITGLPEPAQSATAGPGAPAGLPEPTKSGAADQGAPAGLSGAAGDGAGPALATRAAVTAPAKVRMPWTVIAVHGVLATATIMLVLLAAIAA